MTSARYYAETSSSKINSVFGERVATIRHTKGFSQTLLAERAGVSRATIANIELGKQNVLLHQVYSLSRALHCDPVSLLPELQSVSEGFGSQADTFVEMAKARLNILMGGTV
jgi:transcriptional regulator with XRE-family HTH domain